MRSEARCFVRPDVALEAADRSRAALACTWPAVHPAGGQRSPAVRRPLRSLFERSRGQNACATRRRQTGDPLPGHPVRRTGRNSCQTIFIRGHTACELVGGTGIEPVTSSVSVPGQARVQRSPPRYGRRWR
jgi:hypothetical protein